MFERTFFFLFVLSDFLIDAGESGVITSKTIDVGIGEDAILPCNLSRPSDTQSLRVEWTHDGKEVHLYRNGNDELNDQHQSFKGRTSLFHEKMSSGNISLKLTNVNAQDSGTYTCHVYTPNFSEHFKECSIVLHGVATLHTKLGSKPDGTGAIVAVAVIIAMAAGVGVFLLVKNRVVGRKRRRHENMEQSSDVRINLNNTRNDDDADQ